MQIGTCIASSIIFLRSESQGILNQLMTDIRQLCQLSWPKMPLLKLKVNLYIFLEVVKSKQGSQMYDQKKVKNIMEPLTNIIGPLPESYQESSELKDQVIALALRIYITLFVQRNKEKVAENEQRAMRQSLFVNLFKSKFEYTLGTQAYLVYTWIVFDKFQLCSLPADQNLTPFLTEQMLLETPKNTQESGVNISGAGNTANQQPTDLSQNLMSENLDTDLFKYFLQLYGLIKSRETQNIYLKHMKVIIQTHFRKIQGAIMQNDQLKEAIQEFLQLI